MYWSDVGQNFRRIQAKRMKAITCMTDVGRQVKKQLTGQFPWCPWNLHNSSWRLSGRIRWKVDPATRDGGKWAAWTYPVCPQPKSYWPDDPLGLPGLLLQLATRKYFKITTNLKNIFSHFETGKKYGKWSTISDPFPCSTTGCKQVTGRWMMSSKDNLRGFSDLRYVMVVKPSFLDDRKNWLLSVPPTCSSLHTPR